jgi:hypothetical protein
MPINYLVDVPAQSMWVETPVWVHPGDVLDFSAKGTWIDGVIRCSANGYRARIFYALNLLPRIPDEGRYFRLMGRIVPGGTAPAQDEPGATFPVGKRNNRTVAAVGRLFVFANDRRGFYWNNRGSVQLAIAKTSALPAITVRDEI